MIARRLTGFPTFDQMNSLKELDILRRGMDRLAQGLSGRYFDEPGVGVFPALNVTEDSGNFYIRAELPGIKADQLDISVTEKSMSISGERKPSDDQENLKFHRMERESGKFSRVISFPIPVDTSNVEARSKDGVLTVVLPKSEAAKPKQITVKAS
ncbi:Hsp20/alpha crystallin family protein [Thermodesulfobacteriota bacterium]